MTNEIELEEIQNENVIVLVDEDEQEHSFEIIEVIEVDGQSYAVLAPIDQNEDDEDSAIVLKMVQEDGEEMLYDIEDDEEWTKVVAAWNELIEE